MPTPPQQPPPSRTSRVAASGALALVVALVASGCSLFTFGRNNVSQLGDGTTTASNTPVGIATSDEWVVGAQSRGDFSCAIRDDRTMWCWGFGTEGQLGNGTTTSSSTPVQAGSATNWARVATGDRSACAIRSDGTLWCWGNNTFGQNAQGTFGGGVSSPTQVGTDTDWARIGAGNIHYCAIKTDGTMWCWGGNGVGQLGIGTSSGQVAAPLQSGSDSDWAEIGAGTLHNCAIKTTGTLWCWGENGSGQVGDGSTTERQSPTQVGSATDWKAVSGGSFSSCGTRGSAQTAWCWGYNGAGAVGDGTTDARITPTQVLGGGGWGSISTGNDFSCGVKNRELFCWGSNFHGQLGDGSNTDRHSPTQVGAAADWVLVYAGFNMTTALRD